MLCPYCKKEMKKGYLQANSNILFSEQKHILKMKPSNDEERVLAKVSVVSGASIYSYYCKECDKYIIDGSDINK